MKVYHLDIRDITESRFRIYYQMADEARRARCDACRQRADKLRCMAGDHLARTAIGEFCGIDRASVRFERSPAGKPHAVGLDAHFNISHSGDYVFCAVSDRPVGIDVEQMRPVKAKLTKKICTPGELAWLQEAPGWGETMTGEAMRRFFQIWTSKEAWFKWTGTGITDLKSFDTLAHIRSGGTFEKDGHIISIYQA